MKIYYKTLAFSLVPLKGQYSVEDCFQIYPCNYPDAPSSTEATTYPLMLEYAFNDPFYGLKPKPEELEEANESLKRQVDWGICLKRLLSSTTNYHFFDTACLTDGMWGIQSGLLETESFTSTWVTEGYMSPYLLADLFKESNKPTARDEYEAPIMKFINEGSEYYHNYYLTPSPQTKEEICLPECLPDVIKAYQNLNIDKKRLIDGVTQLICNGIEILGKMKSLSFLSFVSAIETLANLEYPEKPNRCTACGQPQFKVSRKFRDFLLKYVSSEPKYKKLFDKIYSQRSSIAHTGALLLGDAYLDWGNFEDREARHILQLQTMQFARLSLVNWLLSQNTQKS
ncbi:MAG: hypothetical protein EOO61_01100 [Hymenobacter sp.]|nr:MAG: hypothetical protein EOO61_01100 [Hymenobacter sp.]